MSGARGARSLEAWAENASSERCKRTHTEQASRSRPEQRSAKHTTIDDESRRQYRSHPGQTRTPRKRACPPSLLTNKLGGQIASIWSRRALDTHRATITFSLQLGRRTPSTSQRKYPCNTESDHEPNHPHPHHGCRCSNDTTFAGNPERKLPRCLEVPLAEVRQEQGRQDHC